MMWVRLLGFTVWDKKRGVLFFSSAVKHSVKLNPSVVGPMSVFGFFFGRRVLAICGRKHCVVVGLLVSLTSSGLKVGRSLAKVGGQTRRFQVSFLPTGARPGDVGSK